MRIKSYSHLLSWHIRSWLGDIFSYQRPLPYKVMIQLTNLCNSRCKNCLIWTYDVNTNPQVKEVSSEQIIRFLESLKSELMWISFTGGEPTLKASEIIEIIKRAKELCPKLSIVAFTTNGLLPEKALEIAQVIQSLKLDTLVTISLDGDEATHDYIRGVKGNYQLALETRTLLQDAGIKTHFGITIGEHNHQYMENGYEKDSKNFKAITFTHTEGIYSFKGKVSNSKMVQSLRKVLKNYKVEKLHELIEYIYLRLAHHFFNREKKENVVPCTSLRSTLDVMANGDISPCMFLPPISHVDDFSSSTLQEKHTLEMIQKIKENKCPKCWMNCYAPHSIMYHPLKSLKKSMTS